MKVKNIMFFGFAAAILSAASANATTASTDHYDALSRTASASDKNIVTSKYYVDASTDALKADINEIDIPDVSDLNAKKHTHANGTNTTAVTNNGVVTINVPGVSSVDDADSAAIPTVGALTTYVSDQISAAEHEHVDGGYTTVDSSTPGEIKIDVTVNGAVENDNTGLVTGGTVYTAIQNQAVNSVTTGSTNGTITVDSTSVSVAGLQNAAYQTVATEIADSGTGLTTSDQVYDYVAGVQSTIEGQINTLNSASHTHANGTHTTATESNGVVTINVADSGTVTSGNNELVKGGTVYTAIQDQAVNTVVAGDNNGQIKVDNQNVSVTGLQDAAYQTVATEIADSGTGLTTSDQVYDAINSATTYTVSGEACDDQHPCALVNENGTKVWRRMAI